MSHHPSMSAHTLALYPLSEVDRANRLLVDYLLMSPSAVDLFAHNPDEVIDHAAEARPQADRTRLSDALAKFQLHLGADTAAVDAARLLRDPATPVVTSGQQCGLLTGPLYTVYKAMTTINAARRLSDALGRPVVPVFWVATDDGDRSEADHCGFWDQQFILHQIRYPESAGAPDQFIGSLPAGNAGAEVLEQVLPLIAGLPFAVETEALLRDTLTASADMGEWFCRLLVRLFSAQGLVLCDPRLPEARRLSADILRREITQPLHSTQLVNERARELQRRGYRPQLTKPSDSCNLFRLDGARQRVSWHEGRFAIGNRAWDTDEVLADLDANPGQWTPNAVLRPVVQEYLLGSALFVSGPNELGYWAELHPVFQTFGVEMPPVLPRGAMTLAPPGAARLLQQWQLKPLDILFNYDTVRLNLLAARQPATVEQGFLEARSSVAHYIATLAEVVAEVDPTLTQSVLATHQRMLNELERLERKTLKAVERRSTEESARLERVRKTLFPWRGMQERTLNVFCLYARYGPDLISRLQELLDREEGRHLFVEL